MYVNVLLSLTAVLIIIGSILMANPSEDPNDWSDELFVIRVVLLLLFIPPAFIIAKRYGLN